MNWCFHTFCDPLDSGKPQLSLWWTLWSCCFRLWVIGMILLIVHRMFKTNQPIKQSIYWPRKCSDINTGVTIISQHQTLDRSQETHYHIRYYKNSNTLITLLLHTWTTGTCVMWNSIEIIKQLCYQWWSWSVMGRSWSALGGWCIWPWLRLAKAGPGSACPHLGHNPTWSHQRKWAAACSWFLLPCSVAWLWHRLLW